MAMALETESYEEFHSVIQFSWAKHVSPVKIHCQLTVVCGDVVMNVQQIRKLCRV
jgi:uroporphyrinogen-III decarboxylase